MCGRFAQYSSRDDYFEAAGISPDELTFDAEPLGRYNVAPGTCFLTSGVASLISIRSSGAMVPTGGHVSR